LNLHLYVATFSFFDILADYYVKNRAMDFHIMISFGYRTHLNKN